jgi:hypothetical protein
MLIDHRTARVVRSATVVAPIVIALILAGPVQPGHAATDVFATFQEAGTVTSGSPIVRLSLSGGGKYAIFAKINLDQDDSNDAARITCELIADDVDRNVIKLQYSGEKRVDNAVIPFQVVQEFSDRFVTTLSITCKFPEGDSSLLSFRSAKIMAIKVDGRVCEREDPATCR